MKMILMFILLSVGLFLLDHGASFADSVKASVMEGDSVTLNTGVVKTQDRIRWYCNDTRIAQFTGDLRKTCTDVQCNEGTERFRGRLKLDHQTGSLTIMNTRNTDSGDYKLTISSDSSSREQIFSVSVTGVSAADEVKRETVKEGESVTLDAGVIKNPKDVIWYYNDILIAEITGDQSKICTDVQCKESFRDRLKLDHQTGSLNITNLTTEDCGLYQLSKHISISSISISRRRRSINSDSKRFQVIVDVSVMKGDSVTLNPGVQKNQADTVRWYYNDTLIARINGHQSKTCTDVQCNEGNERFRDRLKLDHQTGSLTIMNTRNTDSGEYIWTISGNTKDHIIIVSVTTLSAGPVAVIVGVLLAAVAVAVAVAAGVIYRQRGSRKAVTEPRASEESPINEMEYSRGHMT